MAWVKPLYGKGQVDWAGEFLAGPSNPPLDEEGYADFSWFADDDQAVRIANNWRAVHSYPLQVIKMVLKRRAQRIYPHAIVGQRLKRLPSIRFKLKLSKDAGNHPNHSQMQDIGGCRAVMQTIEQVRALEARFAEASKKNPKRGPQHFRTTDYLLNPKPSGYRSVHLIYKYKPPP